MRAIVIGLTGLMALPAMAEDQAALTARIMAMSVTAETSVLPAKSWNLPNADQDYPSPELRQQNRIVLQGCALSAEIATTAEGPRFPLARLTIDLANAGITLAETARHAEGSYVVFGAVTGELHVEVISMSSNGRIEAIPSQIRAGRFRPAHSTKFFFPMHFGPDDAGRAATLLDLIADYRTNYCAYYS